MFGTQIYRFKFLNKIQRCMHIKSDVVDSIKSIVGSQNFSQTEAVRAHHSKDESFFKEALPDIIVFPENTKQVSNLLKICNQHKIPVVPFGVGSGMEGGVNAINGGITLNMSRNMANILAVHVNDFDCIVEAGVTRIQLNNHLKDTGVWFTVDPGADASIGGMCSTSASGTNAVRYGTMRENVLNLEVVLADGSIINTAGLNARSRKNVAGYNLTNLIVGSEGLLFNLKKKQLKSIQKFSNFSEGTLGVITKATLKLYPQPEVITSAVVPFPDAKSAVQASVEIMQTGLSIARIEFLDENSINGANIYNKLNLDVAPTLFLEFHGSSGNVEQQAEVAHEICKQNSCKSFNWASDLEERNKLWKARHNVWFSLKALYPNRKAISTDICVPISNIVDIIVESQKEVERLNLKTMILGHIGDGNFHTCISLDTENVEEMENFRKYTASLTKYALKLDGTCTGEHGVGLGKKKYLINQFGQETMNTMKLIKKSLDPNGIMNPGKIL